MNKRMPDTDQVQCWIGFASSGIQSLLKISSVPLQLVYGLDLIPSLRHGLTLAGCYFSLLILSGLLAWTEDRAGQRSLRS